MERQKLRTHLLINIISFAVIIFVIMTGLLVIFTSKTVENMIFDKTDDTLRIIEVEMDHYINHPIEELKIIAEIANETLANTANPKLRQDQAFYDRAFVTLNQNKDLLRVDVFDENGIVTRTLPYTEGIIGFDLSANNIYKKIKYSEDNQVLGEMITDPFLDKPTMYISLKLDKGYIVGYLNLEAFQEMLKNVIIDSGDIGIVDEYGTYMSHTDNSLVEQRVVDPLAKKIKEGLIENGSKVMYAGEKHILQYKKIKNTNWFVLFYQDVDVINKPITRAIITIILIFSILLPILIFILFRIIRIVDTSLDKLVMTTQKVADGHYQLDDSDFYYDEFNRLFDSVKHMSKKVSLRENEVVSLNQELETNYYTMIVLLAKAIEAKDHYTGNHCERVRDYSMLIGEALGLNNDELRELKFGSTLHDIGKLGIPEAVLNKPGKFTDNEYMIIKSHSQLGFDIMYEMPSMVKAKQIILHHHERVDGKGYPYGLQGQEIPLLARIVSIADSFDAMTSERPYREYHMSKKEGFIELRRNAGNQFDAELVEIFIERVKNTTHSL